MTKRIIFDLDNTLVNTKQRLHDYLANYYGKDNLIVPEVGWWFQVKGIPDNKLEDFIWNKSVESIFNINRMQTFEDYNKMRVIFDGLRLLNGFDIYLASANPYYQYTIDFANQFKKRFDMNPFKGLFLGWEKNLLSVQDSTDTVILVDDDTRFLDAFTGMTLRMDRELKYIGKNVVHNLDEVMQILKEKEFIQ